MKMKICTLQNKFDPIVDIEPAEYQNSCWGQAYVVDIICPLIETGLIYLTKVGRD